MFVLSHDMASPRTSTALPKWWRSRSLTIIPFRIALDKGYLQPRTDSSSVVHDNACGTGAVTKELVIRARLAGQQPPRIVATDINTKALDALKEEKEAAGWDTVSAAIADCGDMRGLESDYFTHSITNFGIWWSGAGEIHRTLRKGGTAFLTTFKVSPWVELINQVRSTIRVSLPHFPPGSSPDWFKPEFVGDKLRAAGFVDVRHDLVTYDMPMDSVEEMLEEFHEPFWMMARADLSDEEKEKWDPALRRILEQRRSLVFTFEVWVTTARK